MGHHYVPQRYLKGFHSPDKASHIWMFDKKQDTSKHLPITVVAQQSGYYEIEDENSLNLNVEIPGNDVIDKLCLGEQISETEKQELSLYIATAIRRVPAARHKAHAITKQTAPVVIAEYRAEIEIARQSQFASEEQINFFESAVDNVETEFTGCPTDEIRKFIETPWPSESWVHAVFIAKWRVLKRTGSSRFLTSDNPATFFEAYGMNHPDGELIFPLDSNHLLHGSHRRVLNSDIVIIPERMVKEFNKRTASSAHRFVFYHENAGWVLSASKNHPETFKRTTWT